MAIDVQKINAIKSQQFYYKSREPYFNGAKHFKDKFKNLGYDYRGKILKKTTSPEIWSNPLQIPFYSKLEAMITFLFEEVKMIKKTFSIAHNKDSLNIN